MRIQNIISASVLSLAVLLTASGCAQTGNKENPAPTSTSTTTVEPSSNPAPTGSENADSNDLDGILLTINGYYYFISQSDSSDRLKDAEAAISERPASDEAIQKFAEDFSEGFKYFDTSTAEKTKAAYKALMIGASAGKMNEGLKMTIPADSVTISGDTATVNTTYLKVTLNGEKKRVAPEENPADKDIVNLVKNDSEKWVIVPKESSTDPSSP
jgi:hypothetical protein